MTDPAGKETNKNVKYVLRKYGHSIFKYKFIVSSLRPNLETKFNAKKLSLGKAPVQVERYFTDK
jgi:hypothetical protein